MINDQADFVATRLFASEEAVDRAIIQVADFTRAMPVARLDAGLSAGFGHDALEKSVDALQQLVQVRRAMVLAHGSLERSVKRAGLPEVQFGSFVDKPSRNNASATQASQVA